MAKQLIQPDATPAHAAPLSSGLQIINGQSKPRAQRIGLYGPGGVGKTELVANAQNAGFKVIVLDLDEGAGEQAVDRVEREVISSWPGLRQSLQQCAQSDYDIVAIDTLTVAEEMACVYSCEILDVKGEGVTNIDSFSFGKGRAAVYNQWLLLLGDMDKLIRAGKHLVCVMHDDITEVANPLGEDYKIYQPRLQASKSSNIRAKTKEWLDHLLFVQLGVEVKDGKVTKKSGVPNVNRTIFATGNPCYWAKSRFLTTNPSYPKGDSTIWNLLLKRSEA